MLAALESGKLAELGYGKVERVWTSLGLALEARHYPLDAPSLEPRHYGTTWTWLRSLTGSACRTACALEPLISLYAEFTGEDGNLVTGAVVRLANPGPYDLTDIDLNEYTGIIAPRNDWRAVGKQRRMLASALLTRAPGRETTGAGRRRRSR